MHVFVVPAIILTAHLFPAQAATHQYFRINVLDDRTGRGVPLVEVRTVNGIAYFTDSAGVVAFHEPGLMDKDVFFHVSSHGYEFAKDGFGYRGKMLRVKAGGEATLKIRRINIAERLYRVTGAGIYRDSVLVGAKTPLREPVLNGLVFGSDSVVNAIYRGRIHWFWGDTNRPAYPLGNFQVPGAVSQLPGKGGLDPEVGVNLDYFLDGKGFAKQTMRMPGKGPTWMTTLVPLPDDKGEERLYASYVKVEAPLTIYARGLAVFDDDKQEFKHLTEVDMKSPVFPSGHAFRHRDGEVKRLYFAHPFPVTRVRATAKDFLDIAAYESFTCLKEGSKLADLEIDRDAKGRLRYAWRKNAPALGSQQEAKLLAAGKLKPHETRWLLRDVVTGKNVTPHGGSVYWNEHRRRWVMIAVQHFGTSLLGEVWYAEADTPIGPWLYAVKIVTHERYSFYNPKQHPMFDKDKGRVIFFEGTYTHTFSGNPQQTPRYDYNQIMYKLDLADERLALPVAIYDISPGKLPTTFASRANRNGKSQLAFFALDRSIPQSIPIMASDDGLKIGRGENALFHALPADSSLYPGITTPLYEYRHAGETQRVYSVDASLTIAGYQRQERPLCRVWKSAF